MPINHYALKFSKSQRARSGEYIHCLNCGILFYLPKTRITRGEKYCSKDCYKQHKKVKKTCQVCGKVFFVNKGIEDRYTVCSLECRRKFTKYQTCERCGKAFTGERRLNRHYCSEECRRPTAIFKCEICGKEFRKRPSFNPRYCSIACYRRSRKESSIEKIIRLILIDYPLNFIQEYKVGRYSIDFYLPELNIALEVDGDYWHQNIDRDIRKENKLNSVGLRVVRIKQSEIEKTKDLHVLLMNKISSISFIAVS